MVKRKRPESTYILQFIFAVQVNDLL